MIFETLSYVDANGATQEVALNQANIGATSGVLPFKITPKSHAPGECVLTWPSPPEHGMVIPFRSYCIIYASRTSAAGLPNTFTGGSILFQGRRWDNEGAARAGKVTNSVTLLDAWKELEKITFAIEWQEVTGGTIAAPTYTPFLWPDVVLLQPAPNQVYNPLPALGGYITTWQQIQDVINFAIGFIAGAGAVKLQLGPLNFVPTYSNWYPVRSEKCAQCIIDCLRVHPGVMTEIDYTTTPPTLNFRNVTTVTPVTLPYASTIGGVQHIASEITPLPELIPDAVRISYSIEGAFNGQPVINFGTDIWPLNAPNSLLCFDYSLKLTGSSVTEVTKNFASAAFSPTDLTFWRLKVPGLRQLNQGGQIPNDGAIGALQLVSNQPYNAITNLKGYQVIDEAGNPIDVTNTFIYYTDQSVYAWFNLGSGAAAQAVKATVRAFFSYEKSSPIGNTTVIDTVKEHEHHMRVMLTNAPTNEYYIKQTTQGEAVITGLSKTVWTELQPLQWKLRHEIIQVAPDQVTVPTIIKPGKHCINLAGGDVAWETMNAMPEQVSIEFFRNAAGQLVAKHTISCGPVNHLNPQQLTQLANLFWYRDRTNINANQRLTGTVADSSVDLTATDSRENSTDSPAVPTTSNNVNVDNAGNATIIKTSAQDAANALTV